MTCADTQVLQTGSNQLTDKYGQTEAVKANKVANTWSTEMRSAIRSCSKICAQYILTYVGLNYY